MVCSSSGTSLGTSLGALVGCLARPSLTGARSGVATGWRRAGLGACGADGTADGACEQIQVKTCQGCQVFRAWPPVKCPGAGRTRPS